MDWADRFIKSIYSPVFSHIFKFQQFFVGERYLKTWEQECSVKITRDYINFKAWVVS